jgi:hypothetical protein
MSFLIKHLRSHMLHQCFHPLNKLNRINSLHDARARRLPIKFVARLQEGNPPLWVNSSVFNVLRLKCIMKYYALSLGFHSFRPTIRDNDALSIRRIGASCLFSTPWAANRENCVIFYTFPDFSSKIVGKEIAERLSVNVLKTDIAVNHLLSRIYRSSQCYL